MSDLGDLELDRGPESAPEGVAGAASDAPVSPAPPASAAPSSTVLPFVRRGAGPSPHLPASGSPELEAEVLPYRRRDLKRHKRSLWLRLLEPAALALTIVGLPVALVIWLLQAPQFAVRKVGFGQDWANGRVSKAWVEQALAAYGGRNIWELPLSEVEASLRQHPWVSSVGVRKEPPGTLVVSVMERRAVALYRDPRSELYFVDGAGRLIDRFDVRQGAADLPIFSGGDPDVLLPPAIAMLHELEQVRPPWLEGLSEIEILGERDFRLFTADIPFPLLVRAGTLNEKARRLQALLPQIVERYPRVTAVDLRFARRIIVQPTDLGLATPASGPTGAGRPGRISNEATTDHAEI